jgi:putative tricarboxylic transport membrane protein
VERARRGLAPAWQDTAFGLGVLALASVQAWQVLQIPAAPIYAAVGPSVVPWIVVAMTAALGLALTLSGLRGGWEHEDDSVGAFDARGAAWLGLGLLLNLVLIAGADLQQRFGIPLVIPELGFIIASTLMFVCVARAFGSAQPIRDAAVGFVLAFTAYFGFDQILGFRIGAGYDAQITGPAVALIDGLAAGATAAAGAVGLRLAPDLVRALAVGGISAGMFTLIALAGRLGRR